MTNQDVILSIRAITEGTVPQNDISELLFRHKCTYLLSLYQNQYSHQLMLERIVHREAVKERYKALQPFFESTDIPYVVVKGAVLSKSIYGNELLRVSGDIDLLIRKQDCDKIKKTLLSYGFIQGKGTKNGIVPFPRRAILFQTSLSHQTAPYAKATDNRLCPYINVDINTDIIWGESNKKTDMDFVLSYICKTQVSGVTVNKLTPEMEFIALCLHHYKDMNSIYLLTKGRLRLSLFLDIYLYLKTNAPDKQILHQMASTLQVSQYIHYCLYYTNQIFYNSVTKEYLILFEDDQDSRIIDCYGLDDSERKTWQISFYERLFHENLPDYLQTFLTGQDIEKIKRNQQYM